MPKSAMPVLCRALVPEVLPAVMPDLPAVPGVLPAPLPDLVLPSRLPLDLPAEGRAALAVALDGALPAAQAAGPGGTGTPKRCLPAGMMRRSRGCAGSCAR